MDQGKKPESIFAKTANFTLNADSIHDLQLDDANKWLDCNRFSTNTSCLNRRPSEDEM